MRYTLMALACAGLLSLSGDGRSADSTKSSFFNGKDLGGWEGLTEYWSAKDGAIVGSTPEGLKFNTFLCSKQKYTDFELTFKIRLKGGAGNSGVQIRSKIINDKTFAVGGPQCDIGEGYWGSLYGEHFGGMMKAASKESQKVVKKDDFNDYYIKCVGKHVTIKLNGQTTVDDDFAKMPETGIIAWQLHAGGPMEVTFKDIHFKDLSKK
jgi:hypothetical protein